MKFPDAERHQVFLEPEGLDTAEMYVNGLSTSLPPRVQLEFLRLVPGLEQVHMTRPGYAIEYDYFPPTQLLPSLEVRTIPGLFFAGQINGTTGYEEAAGQGVLAGINAAAVIRGIEPLVLRRDEAFLGVLADDLVTRGVDEPYRLFTSRAEYRLLLRQDNALRRLLPVAESRGLLTDHELRSAHARLREEERIRELGRETAIRPELANPILEAAGGKPINQPTRAQALARRPGVALAALLSEIGGIDEELTQWAEIEFKYEGYLNREREAAARLGELEDFALPEELAYAEITTISIEAREKLGRIRPQTLGQAGRVPGISPSDLHSLVTRVARLKRD